MIKIEVFTVFGDYGLRDTFQEQITPKALEMEQDNVRIKFSAINVNLNGPSHDFLLLDSRRPVHEAIK